MSNPQKIYPGAPSPSRSSVGRTVGILGGLTGLSRVLGFIRDLVIATAFGTGMAAEAFVVSFKIPNLLRDLVGEGAMNSAFVPVLTECREKKPERFWRLVSTLFLGMGTLLAILTALGVWLAPQGVALLAPGFGHSAEVGKFSLTVGLTRAVFPYIFLVGLSALAMGILNSRREFASSAMGPVLLNICMILSGYFLEKWCGPMALVIGVLAGGVLQFGFQIPSLARLGFRWERPDFRDSSVKTIGRLLIPRALGSTIYQINVFVDTILASFERIVGPGGQSALYYSNRLFQLPLAIFGISLAQALLPTFSAQMVHKDREGFRQTFSLAVRTLLLAALPASVGLAVLARPIVSILFEHGRFNAYSTTITSGALFFYAWGLVSCCLIKILVNAFYAMQDTRTPVKTMFLSVAVNVLLCFLFMRPLKVGGLALASSLSATLNLGLLYVVLRKKMGDLDEKRILSSFVKIMTASSVMGLAAFGFDRLVLSALVSGPVFFQAVSLALGIALCAAIYGGGLILLKGEELQRIFRRPCVPFPLS